jgi:NifU-like protein involved in Fe-S cluster formation
MITDPYNARVREFFTNTAHAGTITGAPEAYCDEQGVRAVLSAAVREDRVQRLQYQVRGCPHCIAACEAICADLEGQDVAALEKYSVADLMQSLAVPAQKSGRILALEDTVRRLGAALRGAISPQEQD